MSARARKISEWIGHSEWRPPLPAICWPSQSTSTKSSAPKTSPRPIWLRFIQNPRPPASRTERWPSVMSPWPSMSRIRQARAASVRCSRVAVSMSAIGDPFWNSTCASSMRHHGSSFDLDFGQILDQGDDLHQGHGRKMLAHGGAVGVAQFAQVREIVLLVDDEPGQAGDVLRPAAGLGHQRHDVRQSLARLRDKIRAVEFLLRIPADLAGEEHHAAFGGDAVGKAFRLFPVFRMQKLVRLAHRSGLAHDAPGRRRKRWIFPVGVFGSASVNFTERGYLNGAMVALT